MDLRCRILILSFIVPFITITSASILFYGIVYFNLSNGGIGIAVSLLTALAAATLSAVLVSNALGLCR